MKKNTFVSLIFLSLFLFSSGQNKTIEFGFQSGVNINAAYGNSGLKNYSGSTAGVHVGVHFKMKMNRRLALKAILAYDQNGWAYRSLTFTDDNGNDLGTGDLVEKINYLNLPILAEYSFGKKIKFNVDAGFFAGYLLKYTAVQKIKEPVASTNTFALTNRKAINFGLSAGAGVQIPVSPKMKLDFGIRDNVGLANIYKPQATENSTIKTNSFSIISGFTYRIK